MKLGGLVLLSLGLAVPLSGQVGYSPDHSPYHDIRVGSGFAVSGGYISGSRGVADVGPSQGHVWTFSYERPFGRTLGARLILGDAMTTRFIVDPTKDSVSRKSGPVDNNLLLAYIGLTALLSGGKTWHGFAPYIGVGGGVANAQKTPGDTSTYNFGTKAILGPNAGLRWYPARRVSVRADAMLVFWKLSYPLQFKQPSLIDGSRVLQVDANPTEWTHHPWFSIGLAWTL